MTQGIIIAVIGAVGVLLAAVIGVPRIVRDSRWRIQRDLEIYNALPPSSGSKSDLLSRIDREVAHLDLVDQERRHPLGMALGLAFVLMGGALLWFVILYGGWWWVASPVALTLLLFGVGGLALSSKKVCGTRKTPSFPRNPKRVSKECRVVEYRTGAKLREDTPRKPRTEHRGELRSGGGKALKPQKSSAACGVFDQSQGSNGYSRWVAAGKVDGGREA